MIHVAHNLQTNIRTGWFIDRAVAFEVDDTGFKYHSRPFLILLLHTKID